MKDKLYIGLGLAAFLVVAVFPVFYNAGSGAVYPKPVLTEKAKASGECVRSKDYMRKEHMQLLDSWRHSVVRNGERIYVSDNGKEYLMSLSNTCMDCHQNKTEFCDTCHNYASVRPYCWDCHIDNPKGEN